MDKQTMIATCKCDTSALHHAVSKDKEEQPGGDKFKYCAKCISFQIVFI